MPDPDAALQTLAATLREEETPISAYVVEPAASPELGTLVASGPRTASAPGEYALVVEAVREGYLLHYGQPRLLAGHDSDLALLAGDYLYALGLDRIASLGDTAATPGSTPRDGPTPSRSCGGPPPVRSPAWGRGRTGGRGNKLRRRALIDCG
jgi:hypothetical protein